ncbi:unnamed protein product, partial [marine sediment metagenome]
MDLNGRILTEQLQEKWRPIVEHAEVPAITDPYRKAVTTVLLENQAEYLSEAAPTNRTGGEIDNWDPILISLVRRAMPNLIAFDICGVQPMTGPTGLIFAMKSHYTSQTGNEALGLDEADTTFAGAQGAGATQPGGGGPPQNPALSTDPFAAGTMTTGQGMTLADGEA